MSVSFRLLLFIFQIKEEDGDVAGAAEVLQEVHVETYGALNKEEKADFILEQVGTVLLGAFATSIASNNQGASHTRLRGFVICRGPRPRRVLCVNTMVVRSFTFVLC